MSSQLLRCGGGSSAVAAILLVLGQCHAAWGANPNTRDPLLPLDIHNLTNAQAPLSTASTVFTSLLKDIQAIGANPARVAPKKVSELHIQIRQLRRAAVDLQMLGETAGVDYSLRAAALSQSLSQIVAAVRSTPAGQAYANQAQQVLPSPKATQARKAMAQKLQALLQQEKLEEAYQELNTALDQLTSLTLFMDTRAEELYTMELVSVGGSITNRRITAFREQAKASLDQLITSQLPATAELLKSMAAAAAALQSAPQAPIGDQKLAGPQCLEHFGGVWKQQHLSALRCRAMDWARITNIPDVTYLGQIDPQQVRLTDDAVSQFYESVTKALASLIEADAQRATPAEVPLLYQQYLQVLAPLIASTPDDKLQLAVQPALERLAGKSAPFAEEVKSYQTATHELLRWRERLAQSSAAAAAASFPPSDQTLLKSFQSEGEFRGLFIPSDTAPNRAVLTASCPQVIPVAGQRALEQPILVRDLAGLTGGKLAVARYHDRHYATLPLPDAAAEVTRLQQELLVTAQQPAMSLEAALALDSAQRGNYAAAGGAIKGLHLEGLIPRFAALRPEAQSLVALGPLPAEVPPLGFISHVLVRLDVAPAWVQHRYFFLSVANAAPAAPK